MIKAQKLLKNKNLKFELAETNDISSYKKQINMILKLLGHPEALVTDESIVWDFTAFLSKSRKEVMLKYLSKFAKFEVSEHTKLIDIAKNATL